VRIVMFTAITRAGPEARKITMDITMQGSWS
jgi:hypothetical protein